jgi:hypothetical protein
MSGSLGAKRCCNEAMIVRVAHMSRVLVTLFQRDELLWQ